jgi:NAD(P)-dependent dehydrogenase (short-subunit alcohol dehydrogenase family)
MVAESRKRVALVTGANRGIGLEVSRQLAAKGLHVVLTGRDRDHIESAADQLRRENLDVSAAAMDVTDEEGVEDCARTVRERLGSIDVLVNNAAVLVAEDASVLETTLEEFRTTFEANVFGAVSVCRAFVPSMVTNRYGRVVNVSSAAGQLSSMSTYAPAYSISKAALNAFTVRLAAELKGTGVLVNSVNPGWVRTRMGGRGAPRSVAQGTDTIVWAATLPANGPTGGFFSERQRIDW